MTEEEKQEKLLLLLLALARSTERRITSGVRRRLIDVMRRLRRLIQTLSPDGVFRQIEWTRIQGKALPLLEEITATLRFYMLPQLQQLVPDVQDAAYDFAQFEEDGTQVELQPKTQDELARTISAGKLTLVALLGRGEGYSRFTLQMADDLNRMVRGQILAEATTQQISDKVIKLIQQRGTTAAVIKTGSYANQMWNRVNNTTAAAVWDTTSKELLKTWQDVPAARWRYNALLDPVTCPICRPLDGQVRNSPGEFPFIPPVHPRCRCAIIPELS